MKQQETIIFGENCSYSTDPELTGLNNNVIVCGGSGSGKTMSISEPRLLGTTDSSIITTVTKRRLVNKYKPLFVSRGYEVLDLDFAEPKRGNVGYNPLAYIQSTRDITFLAESIVKGHSKRNSTADPFWDDSAVSLLSAEIAYTLYHNRSARFTDVLEMHENINPQYETGFTTSYDQAFEELAEENVSPAAQKKITYTMSDFREEWRSCYNSQVVRQGSGKKKTLSFSLAPFEQRWELACRNVRYNAAKRDLAEREEKEWKGDTLPGGLSKPALAKFAVSCWNTYRKASCNTASCIFGALNGALDNLFTQEIRSMMAMRGQVDFTRLANKKTILFVTTNPVNTSLSILINLFYGHAIKQLFEYAEGRPDGMLPIPVHIICDDFATGGRIPNFAEYISIFREKRISVTLLLQSESQLVSMYGSTNATTIINNCDTYIYLGGMDVGTARNVSRRLNVPMSEVLNMPIGQELLFRRGCKPVITTRYNILKDPLYQQVTRDYEKCLQQQEKSRAS